MEESGVSDKRVERSKAKVLAETYRQMAQSGIGGLSIDEVSRASGISKTTIYRHWPSRSALLIDACSRLGSASEAPDTGNVEHDVRLLLSCLADQLQTANWSAIYPSILDAAERDPELSAMQQSLHDRFMDPFLTVLTRATDRGEISADRPHRETIAMLVGPLFFRRWFSRETIDEAFIDRLTRTVLG
ncbi:TetR/AcrR family transcriptional regulator [Sphingomonas sp.]|uniref:TetR/AcrR family transcriptional regulator n=1 Tax=Sphingomonas sp. TaxID=28214 RepID=UPI0025D80652|nr:TetR/AcrR family transcriptional regulator [Sphingomonas sp.]